MNLQELRESTEARLRTKVKMDSLRSENSNAPGYGEAQEKSIAAYSKYQELLVMHPETILALITCAEALKQIKQEGGRVCDDFELCKHIACQSSYSSWMIADTALAQLEEEP